jgi:hypothetical protein
LLIKSGDKSRQQIRKSLLNGNVLQESDLQLALSVVSVGTELSQLTIPQGSYLQ